MSRSQLYRVCLKSGTLDDIPTFRIKIGKAEKKINPYFIPSDKQRYNCDSILQRHNEEPQCIISVFYAYKFIGSGSVEFNKKQMPNERVEILNRDKQRVASLDLSLISIQKVVQVPALDIRIDCVTYDDVPNNEVRGTPFLVLKYGQLNYQTEKEPTKHQGQYTFMESFKFPESEMERIIVEHWCSTQTDNRFLGVSLVNLHYKQDHNKDNVELNVSYMSKLRGKLKMSIHEDKQKKMGGMDYSNAPKRTIKTTVVEAVMLNPSQEGVFIRLKVAKEKYDTTPLFVTKKELKWNQAFTMEVNSEKQELQAELCLKDDTLGRSFLQIAKVANRTYELTLLDQEERDIGKIYLQFYDHQLFAKQRKRLPKELADKITADLQLIKNRYRQGKPLHQYMQGLHAVLQEGIVAVAKKEECQDPLYQLGTFLVNYQKP